ncbi:MAG: ATP-binding protein [Cytophagales bacterium]|nr:ATP-binding protein [Cytophagales bacterium]
MIIHKTNIPCSTSNLKVIRTFLNKKLTGIVSLSTKQLNLLILAVEEVCTNLITHSNLCDINQEIIISIKINKTDDKEEVFFELLDRGEQFDYNNYDEPSIEQIIEERRKGSLGLKIVKRVIDKMEFTTEGSYNVCRLYKNTKEFNVFI